MCVRVLLSLCVFLTLLFSGLRTQAAESRREDYQQAKAHVEKEEWQQAIRLLHKVIQENPTPRNARDLDWTGWESYYPYLELGKAYLKINDPFSASYYCSRSLAEGFSPEKEVLECLATAKPMLKYYREGIETRGIPKFPLFPWPPPTASAWKTIPQSYLRASGTQASLKDVATRLEKALLQTGYVELSYYQIPEGFALVTRIEQFEADGISKKPPDRWALDIPPAKIFSFGDYLKALFSAEKGYYRLISFLVTSVPSGQTRQKINREDALAWLSGGMNVLPAEVGEQPYSEYHYCMAYIYEFEQTTRNHDAEFKSSSMLTGDVHMEKSLLSEALEKISRGEIE